MLNPLAQELNETLKGTTPGELLSDLGKRIFFPRGIISQGGEAKKAGKVANATLGTTIIKGKPAILEAVHKYAPELTSGELVGYAPTAGIPNLRECWKEAMFRKNPGLRGKNISNPIVVPGLTAGISCLADLFIDEDKPLLTAEPCWDNYGLIVETRRNSTLHQFNLFDEGAFDLFSLKNAVEKEAETGFVRILLNFPQNPSGYSPTNAEAAQIVKIIRDIAENGARVLVISDDAYFGLNYEHDIYPQSLFAEFANLHENILAVKIDGPTKEDFVWGFRVGFLTFGGKSLNEEHYDAIEKKVMGLIRSSVSCSSTPSQSIALKAFTDPNIETQKSNYRKLLENRYLAVKKFLQTHKSKNLEPLPFNSGYFMSFRTRVDAEELRKKLLAEKQIGTISLDIQTLRVAFSSLDEDMIDTVYSAIFECADQM
ncbi:aminotransferase class I/II-fold pyridoxal phosphate-dependent enzyme [Treponema pectinovorum]|uniref:aminotransferase class I/II-fold pyridoxal phosphate-dependent enzyme n=1 Tax=Treponema pectinovorum TaxID=164 RepID=UPI0011C85DAB|nr:aminotransferase class I/II-fold pyridoxal phosphate-dependent enzyme [Treponema pectinovorum]